MFAVLNKKSLQHKLLIPEYYRRIKETVCIQSWIDQKGVLCLHYNNDLSN